MSKFNPMEPFANKKLLNGMVKEIRNFNFKLYQKIDSKFYRGKPTKYEFDLNLGMMHFTELDFKGLSEIFARTNRKWKTQLTFCIYPAKERNRNLIMNVRAPMAPMEND
jgi:hypothetical protein